MVNGYKVFHHQSPNFGDFIAKEIVQKISGEKVVSISENELNCEHFVVTGSILTQINNNSIVWGAGIAYANNIIPKAKKFIAVRGELTAKKVYDCHSINCEAIGDPVMLVSELYDKCDYKEYRLGIIPHWVDYYQTMAAYRDCDDVLIIDVLKKPGEVIKEISLCEKTISSSLHGIVASHSLGVPCMWVKFSKKILGDDFKYHDYFSSVKIKVDSAFMLFDKKPINEIIKNIVNYEIKFDKNKFLSTCPF